MSAFLVLMFVMHSGGAVGGPAWTSWMADVVPDRSRGKYFSRRRQWGIASAIPAALFAGWLLDRLNQTRDGESGCGRGRPDADFGISGRAVDAVDRAEHE